MISRREKIRRVLQGVDQLCIDVISDRTEEPREGVKNALVAMKKRGEVIRVNRGCYCLAEASGKARIWKLLTARKRASLEDVQIQAGVSREEAMEYLAGLKEMGVVREFPGKGDEVIYRLIHDTGPETPLQGDDEIERLMALKVIRELRFKAQHAFCELTKAMEAYDEAYGNLGESHSHAA